MTKFIVSVELVDLPGVDSRLVQEEVHKEMESRGFMRSCPWTSSGEMWLPGMTYILDSELRAADVGARAKEAVSAAKQTGRFFVVPAQHGWWASNLLPVESAQRAG
jgi:hypothetical protein